MSNWCVSGRIIFRKRQAGKRAEVEHDADTVALKLVQLARDHFPGYEFDTAPVAIMQPLSEQMKEAAQ
jgi:hypothetical protein